MKGKEAKDESIRMASTQEAEQSPKKPDNNNRGVGEKFLSGPGQKKNLVE